MALAEWTSPHPLKWEEDAPAALIPFPREVEWQDRSLKTPAPAHWKLAGHTDGRMIKVAWKGLMDTLAQEKASGAAPVTCTLSLDEKAAPKLGREGYTLSIGSEGVRISAAAEAGLFYGLQTLRQLVRSDELSHCTITDYPAFGVRGFMHDCGRNFRPVERIKHELDLAAQLKVNAFHWHMTDYPAWHIECKSYPELNDPRHRTRDKHDTYTYEQIREVCRYAAARNITVIPELDMPGHSAYFDRAFGCKMHSPKGMPIVEKLLREFCEEIPAEMCPIVHFGADEVRIPNAPQFVGMVTKVLQEYGRTPMQWASSRDLPVADSSIEQRWGEGADMAAKSIIPSRITRRAVDSTMGYANLLDPAMLVRRYFFMRPCGSPQGDEQKLGSIICIWPDGRVEDKTLIPLFCAQWPGICAMAERAWVGGAADGDHLPLEMSAPDTEAGKAYSLFSRRMMGLRSSLFRREPFPFWYESSVDWKVIGPVAGAQAESTRRKVLSGDYSGLTSRPAYGANLYFRTRPDTGYLGMFMTSKPGQSVWAVTEIEADSAGKYPFMIGFDAPARSNRRWSGVPAKGQWSQCGARIWLNGRELRNPREYRLAGQRRLAGNQWNFDNPPLDTEEIWWAQKPYELPLKKGKNTIIIEVPYIGEFQSWGVSLIPLKR